MATTPIDELRERAGSSAAIEFMESNGFKLTSSEHNTYGFWFNEKDQMTIGLPQAEYMFSVFHKALEAARLEDNHDWDTETFKAQEVIVCRRCATTYQIRGNKPCKGKMAKIALRSTNPPKTQEES